MTDLCCSVCFFQDDLTMVNATVICKECLTKVKKELVKPPISQKPLPDIIQEVIKNSMGDIYD
jgi:hypothetical protein